MIRAFYNDTDAYCCAWLSNLMDAGLITPGVISDKSIHDLTPDDVSGFNRVHAFAGIAGWELALQLAGWGERECWTGSCPCQPFSAAGKGKASSDERHLWPIWFELIRSVRPAVIFGEQVEAAIGWGWLDLVHSDMEAEGYSIRSAVLPACSVGAPHRRDRLWFVANTEIGAAIAPSNAPRKGRRGSAEPRTTSTMGGCGHPYCPICYGELAHPLPAGRPEGRPEPRNGQAAGSGGDLGNAERDGSRRHAGAGVGAQEGASLRSECICTRSSSAARPWSDLIWLPCTDGKQRPTQPGIFPLASGLRNRVAQLRAAGNSIVPQVAAEFIKASMNA